MRDLVSLRSMSASERNMQWEKGGDASGRARHGPDGFEVLHPWARYTHAADGRARYLTQSTGAW